MGVRPEAKVDRNFQLNEDMENGMTYAEASKKYNVNYSRITMIRQWVQRKKQG